MSGPTEAGPSIASDPGGLPAPAAPAWHVLDTAEVLERLGIDPERGLTEDRVAAARRRHGANRLAREEGPGPWTLLADQFLDPLVLVLLAAAAVSALVWGLESGGREPLPYDALVILAIVALNAAIGFVQEYRAERAVEALKAMTAPEARVRRDGEEREVEASELVPGDILLLRDGDRVPADARVLRSSNLKVEEAALTGESAPESKDPAPVEDPETEVGDRTSMVFMGSAVTYGHGEAVVVATGMATEMGGIAHLIQSTPDEDTPLQRELGRLGRQLGLLVVVISVGVAAAGVIRAGTLESAILLEMFLFGVALAVAAVPEGLPAVVTATLALGMQRLARRNAIVRSLPAVEALGSATVICTDKTGTLTRNEMTVRRILVGSRRTVEVTGHGYGAEGGFRWEEEAPDEAEAHEHLARLLALAALDNDASLVRRGAEVEAHGDPTEVALLVAAAKAGIEVEELRRRRPRRGEIPFSSARRRMTTVHELDDGPTAVMKGAPEVVLDRCTRIREAGEVRELDAGTREEIEARNEAFAGRALRTLAVASRPVEAGEVGGPGAAGDPDPETVEREMVFEGLVGMLDPPREASAPSVRTAARAGIRTLMVTGDHVATARAIAREVGIGDPGDPEGPEGPEGPGALSGREVAALEPPELQEAVGRCSVFGRVDPETKFDIVRALQARGEVVAMTGDGVNDAPAVKTADIGVAMGRTGTDVTREAGDIVLADDDYATIVAAVEEGRTIFSNLRKFIRYLLSANAGEVLTILGAVAAAGALGLRDPGGGFLLPLLPVQILWINLVTDGPPALALGVSPPEPGIMETPPRDPDAPVLGARMWTFVLVSGLTIMAGTLGVLDAYLPGGWIDLPGLVSPDDPVRRARTMAFTTLVMFQVAHVFNCLSQDRSVFRSRVPSNGWLLAAVALSLALHAAVLGVPVLRAAFDTVPLGPREWAVAAGVALSVVAVSELLKLIPWMKGRR